MSLKISEHQWLTPVILATQEAEIRRIWSQPGQTVCETLACKNLSQKKAAGVAQGIGPEFKPQYHKKVPKNNKMNKDQEDNLKNILKMQMFKPDTT
jgi:hypothetical protein